MGNKTYDTLKFIALHGQETVRAVFMRLDLGLVRQHHAHQRADHDRDRQPVRSAGVHAEQ